MDLFKKSTIVGVSVTPEMGLEIAQIDFASGTVIKYGKRPVDYNVNQREIADLDLFKNALQELLMEMQIPKDANIVLSIPAATFKINDYPAALDDLQVDNAIEEELAEHYLFKNSEACYSAVKLPNSSMQFNKIAYASSHKSMIIELVLIFNDLGYKIHAIDTSVNSTLNSLIYLQRVNTEAETPWLLLIVENYCLRLFTMIGKNYIDAFEEKISIGEVLGDSENYAAVIDTISPLLKNIPGKYLCVVSKTNVISAEILSGKLSYSAPIIYQEDNIYSKEAFLPTGPDVDPKMANSISLDVIAAGIYRDFGEYLDTQFNLFNKSLGENLSVIK